MRIFGDQKWARVVLVLCLLLCYVTFAMATSTPSVDASATSVSVSEVTLSGLVVDSLVVVVAQEGVAPVDLSAIPDQLYINVQCH